MSTIEISEEDRRKAEIFLETFLTNIIPDGDFSRGTSLRDHTITAISAVYALFKLEINHVRNATSLRRVANIEDDASFAQAVDNLVENWFIKRKAGRRVRGVATIHFSRPHDGRIPASTVFMKTAGLAFHIDSTETLFYGEQDLTPRIGSQGEVTSYVYRVPIIASHAGTPYEVTPGPFAHVTSISPDFLFAENETELTGARDPESPEELLERVPDSLTKRDLGSTKGIRAVLQDEFSSIDRIIIHGMGDAAMRRDLLNDPHTYYQVHLGGHTDIYVSTPALTNQVFEGEIGGAFTDPRTPVTLFKDLTIDDWRNYVTTGDIIRVRNAAASEAEHYRISRVSKHFLETHARQPFPGERPRQLRDRATFSSVQVQNSTQVRCVNAQFSSNDVGRYIRLSESTEDNDGTYRITGVDTETHTVDVLGGGLVLEVSASLRLTVYENIVEYSIGDRSPAYDNKVSPRMTGEFSRAYQEDGRVLLPANPIYRISEVSIRDITNPAADPITGRVTFSSRVNRTPQSDANSPEYTVGVLDPALAPSTQQMAVLTVGTGVEKEGINATVDTHEDGGVLVVPGGNITAFTVEDVGKTLRITNSSYAHNRGELVISERVSAGEVVLVDAEDPEWRATAESRVHWEVYNTSTYDGKILRVTYDTVSQFSNIDEFVRNRDNHNPNANALVKAFHPVYLSFDVAYQRRRSTETFLDEAEAVRFIVAFINRFPETDTITVSDIVSAFYTEFKDVVSHVQLPLTIYYTLHAPDGRVIQYRTQDEIAIRPDNLVSDSQIDRLEDKKSLGITENTVRYLTDDNLIRLTPVSP